MITKNTIMSKSPFKMKGYSYPGASPLQQKPKKTKMLKGTTIFGHEVSELKSKVKAFARRVELGFSSGIYSTKYKAQNPNLFKKAKINQPRFKAEKEKLLKTSN